MIRLACLVRAHRRVDTLRVVLSELERYRTFPGLEVDINVMIDRPTDQVIDLLGSKTWPHWSVCHAPCEILANGAERFLEAQNNQLNIMERWFPPDWVYVVDDDFALDLDGAARLPEQLARADVDAFYMPCLFVQTSHGLHNILREHNSIRLYRHRPGARFSGKRMLSIPDDLHDEYVVQGRTAQYPGYLLEYGGFTPEDRAATRAAYIAAGKDDAFVRGLLNFDLRPLPPGIRSPFLCPSEPTPSTSTFSANTDSEPTTTPSVSP